METVVIHGCGTALKTYHPNKIENAHNIYLLISLTQSVSKRENNKALQIMEQRQRTDAIQNCGSSLQNRNKTEGLSKENQNEVKTNFA